MAELNIPPERVVRHYDASRKNCPASMSNNDWAYWQDFKNRIYVQELVTPNDIVWELMNNPKYKIEITEVQRAIKAIDKAKTSSEFMSLYWILYKLVNGNVT